LSAINFVSKALPIIAVPIMADDGGHLKTLTDEKPA